MCRRPLAGFSSRMCTGTPIRTVRPLHRHDNVDVTAPRGPCCLCPVSSGHALRAVQPASESACSFLFLQPSVHSFCTPSVHLLYTFCTSSVHLLHILYMSGRSTNPIRGLLHRLEVRHPRRCTADSNGCSLLLGGWPVSRALREGGRRQCTLTIMASEQPRSEWMQPTGGTV